MMELTPEEHDDDGAPLPRQTYLAVALDAVRRVMRWRIQHAPNDEIGVLAYGAVRRGGQLLLLAVVVSRERGGGGAGGRRRWWAGGRAGKVCWQRRVAAGWLRLEASRLARKHNT